MKECYYLITSKVLDEEGRLWNYRTRRFESCMRMQKMKVAGRFLCWQNVKRKVDQGIRVKGYPVFTVNGQTDVWGVSTVLRKALFPIGNVAYKKRRFWTGNKQIA